ncbi:alpha/beta fold hydrolase [Myxococcus sp. AB036A]|uniref:alpha/beta fold hydrolase n=1 Tax=Myxococcus sp. AB036A TaxID=2562793 RepID=UPI00114696FE|nr:alpha/beta fold hydrolase [Myxococcus sp. AB036A]
MPIAELNGQGIYFEDSGGNGRPIILGHGFLMDHRMFDAQVAALAPEFRVIRWDARGFGQTRWDGKPFTPWDSAADCVALLDHLGIERAVVGGMSQGGYSALRVALKHPGRVRALVLMSTRGTNDDAPTRAAYQQSADIWETQGPIDPLVQGLAQAIIGDTRYFDTWLPRWRQIPGGHFANAIRSLIDRDDISGRLTEIRCPAIVFHGLEDHGMPPAHGEHLHQTLPGSVRFIPVPGAAHAANMTHPEAVNPALLEFLRAHA